MVIYPLSKAYKPEGDRYDDKVEEITAFPNDCDSRTVDMPDSTTGSCGKSAIELLQQVSGKIFSM